MQIVVAAAVAPDQRGVGTTLRTGSTIRQSLLRDDTPDGMSFAVNRTEWLPGEDANATPRHHHSFQQIRWAESGSVNYGPGHDIEEGDIAYFPRGAWYGPQSRDRGISVTIQFGFNGEKQHGSKFWDRYQAGAMEQLQANGRFESGRYHDVDPETGAPRVRDSVEALYAAQYEAHTGQQFVIPPEGYAAAIHMYPRAFDYFERDPGVELKHMGAFYDHAGPQADVRISIVRLTGNGRYELAAHRAQIAWTISAGLQIGANEYPEMTYIYSPRGESVSLTSGAGVEFYLVEMPRLD